MQRANIALFVGALLAGACASDPAASGSQAGSAGESGQPQGRGGAANGAGNGGSSMGGNIAGTLGTSGGSSSAGASIGGSTSGGASKGGASNGGSAQGGAVNAGASGAALTGGSGGNGAGNAGAAGASSTACSKAIFCDDFESYAPGTAPAGVFKSQVNGGTISIDETQHVSGTRSVKFTTEAKAGTKTAFLRLEGNAVFPVAGNAYYGRMRFLLETAPTSSVHWTFIQAGGTIAGQTYHALYRYGGQQPVLQGTQFLGNQLMANYETPDSYAGNGPRSDCWHHANKRIVPVGKWSCVEWKFDGPSNQMRLWLDGVALEDLSVNGLGQGCVSQPATYPWTAPTFEHLEVGWESFQMDSARTLFIDDLVISKEPIGCF